MTKEELVGLKRYQYIRIKKDNTILKGLLENRKVAIYFERSYNDEMNQFLNREYDVLLSLLNYHNIAFIYAPLWLKNIDESIRFNIPNSNLSSLDNKISVEDIYKIIDGNLVTKPILNLPMILVSDPENEAGYSADELGDDKIGLYCYYIEYGMDLLNRYRPNEYPCIFNHPSPVRYNKTDSTEEETDTVNEDEGILFREGDEEEPNIAPQDRADWGDIETLSYEIQYRIQRLYDMGLNESFIRQIIALPEPKLSPLTITDEFRILLPDYNNMEIVLHPLSKALYFFYLRHEGGVKFKYLRDYRDEFFNLYSLLSPCENPDKINQSIDNIIDSTKNTVNENCSRIKSAFASKFQDHLARKYYITGKPGEPKRIILDRKLVEDRSGLIIER